MNDVLDLSNSRAAEAVDALSDYLRVEMERAARHALRLHADEITCEHLFTTVMEDEDSAAHGAILFGFGDPPTLAVEALALSPGILVVGSGTSLPFSPLGVRALFRARERAARDGLAAVDTALMLVECVEDLDAEAREGLREAGYDPKGAEDFPTSDTPVTTERGLFSAFDDGARRTLGLACRIASRADEIAIAPGHIVRACVESEPPLVEKVGLRSRDVPRVLAGRDRDASTPPERPLAPDEELLTFLESLPPGAGTLELLSAYSDHGPEGLAEILRRNRIGPELVARAQTAYRDPS